MISQQAACEAVILVVSVDKADPTVIRVRYCIHVADLNVSVIANGDVAGHRSKKLY